MTTCMVAWIVLLTSISLLFDIWPQNCSFALELSHYPFQCKRYALMLCIVATMFFKMATEYGRCNSPNVLEKKICFFSRLQNLYFDTGITTVDLLISEIIHIYMCSGYVFQDGRQNGRYNSLINWNMSSCLSLTLRTVLSWFCKQLGRAGQLVTTIAFQFLHQSGTRSALMCGIGMLLL